MSEDYDGDYAAIALQAEDDVRVYLDRQQRRLHEVQVENQSLMEENTRLHDVNEELHKYLREQRKRLKPDGPLVSRKVLMMAVELLEDAGVIGDPWDDTASNLRYEIKQVTQHEEEV